MKPYLVGHILPITELGNQTGPDGLVAKSLANGW